MTKFARTAPVAAAAKKATRSTTKPQPEVITPVEPIDAAADDEAIHTAYQQVRDAVSGMWAKLQRPSWVRTLVNMTIGIAVYASAWYGCMTLVDMLMLGVIGYTGVGFISFLIAFFAVLLSFMAAYKLGKVAHDLAAAFDYDSVKSRVRGWLSFGSKPAAA